MSDEWTIRDRKYNGRHGGFEDFDSQEEREQLEKELRSLLAIIDRNITPGWNIPDKCFGTGQDKSAFITKMASVQQYVYGILRKL